MRRVHLELNSAAHRCRLVVIDEPGGSCPVPFRSARTLQRFLTHLAESRQYTIDLNDEALAFLCALVAGETPAPQTLATAPAHEVFIQQAGSLAWGSLSAARKRQCLLSLYRPLLPTASLLALSRLSSDVLIARVKAETSPAPSPGQAA